MTILTRRGCVGGIRHFLVGRGEAIITATDGSGNVATASCQRR